MRKKVDSRIRTLVENCVKLGQRSLFVIVGDKGRDQVRRPLCFLYVVPGDWSAG
jgi:hypothetical protein